jgi:hypothetical protein
VEKISWGKPAKKKGTGSRGVPHRLNHDEERKLFDQARRKGFLEVTGSGWRSTRGDAPLVNSYRSLCDARGQVCIILHKGNNGLDDQLVIDLSPLRLPDTFEKLETDIISYVDMPVRSKSLEEEEEEELDIQMDGSEDDDEIIAGNSEDAWNNRPIYQLRPYFIEWELPRSDAKALGKKLAQSFNTGEPKAMKSKKPKHVKHGKSRRSGGYGIG